MRIDIKETKLYIQGDSKRLLKVHLSIILIFFDAGDLRFCTEQLQNYTIWYIKGDRHKTHHSIFKLVLFFGKLQEKAKIWYIILTKSWFLGWKRFLSKFGTKFGFFLKIYQKYINQFDALMSHRSISSEVSNCIVLRLLCAKFQLSSSITCWSYGYMNL